MSDRLKCVRFEIPGEPCGKGRPRFTGRIAYTPKKTASYENLVKLAYKQKNHDFSFGTVPVAMTVEACLAIPKSASKKKQEQMQDGEVLPTKKPDFDNIAKIIGDALNGIAYHDDSQIVGFSLIKRYDERPRVVVHIKEVTNVYDFWEP